MLVSRPDLRAGAVVQPGGRAVGLDDRSRPGRLEVAGGRRQGAEEEILRRRHRGGEGGKTAVHRTAGNRSWSGEYQMENSNDVRIAAVLDCLFSEQPSSMEATRFR
mmetsp:Transcript_47208/g.92128  ORF Transcript_47208/g.92128 Transcript_47208/m.92128 type:complete len:106 (-) Transcript_47208:7-324(-)